MRCLVTGASGYLGGWLASRLVQQGHDVHVVVRTESSRARLPAGLTGIHEDRGDGSSLSSIGKMVAPEMIFHLAALYVWDHSAEQLQALVDANLGFPLHLFDMASAGNIPLVNVGSGFQHVGEPSNPVNLYAVMKQSVLESLRWYGRARGLRSATVVLNDTYGPRDPRGKLFSLLRRSVDAPLPLAMSPGEQLLDLLWVDDAVAAIQAAAATASPSAPEWLASSGEVRTLREVAQIWSEVTGRKPQIIWGARPYREREVMRPWSGGNRLDGWYVTRNLRDGILEMERDC